MIWKWCICGRTACIKAGLEKEKAVILVVIAALSDGTKVVVSVRTRIDPELVRSAAGSQRAGDEPTPSGDR